MQINTPASEYVLTMELGVMFILILSPAHETPTTPADPPPEAKTANQAGIDGAVQAGGNTARGGGW